MKINKLQINDFGKFSNKEINFDDNINLIMGNNESGKSTIQKFILSMFYGLESDRRKGSFTDYDKYLPWGKENFSGKIKYTLDDGQTYEIYRDFTQKNPIVYNENAEDITNQFSTSKSKGSRVFEEQTGIDEKTMKSSMLVEQTNVVVDQTSENFVIQKIANMTETGDEKISYENAQKYLIKKRNEDVGTGKTRNKPINLLQEEKQKLIEEKKDLEEYNTEQYELEQNLKDLCAMQENNDRLLELSTKYRRIVDNVNQELNKIEIYNENIKNNKNEIFDLQKEKVTLSKKLEEKQVETEKNEKVRKIKLQQSNTKNEVLNKEKRNIKYISFGISIVMLIIAIVCFILPQFIIAIVSSLIAILSPICGMTLIKSKNEQIEENNEEIEMLIKEDAYLEFENNNKELKEIEIKIDMLEKNNEELNNKIAKINLKTEEDEEQNTKDLEKEFDDFPKDILEEIFDKETINEKIEQLQEFKNNISFEIEKIEYRKKYILPQLERLAEVEERLCELDDRENEMLEEVKSIEIASQVLEEAYSEMKKNVIPRFTQNLSQTINNITNGKYSKVITNDKSGILVEKDNGEYITANALSVGTIDQLYLSLRFAIIQESSSQIMPIILDEAFAYYDQTRLKNILQYMTTEFKNHQIILFTCTSREKDILNEINQSYKLIELE